jgi:hypothetical protein
VFPFLDTRALPAKVNFSSCCWVFCLITCSQSSTFQELSTVLGFLCYCEAVCLYG